MTTPIQFGPSSTPAIHHSASFPVIATTCGATTIPKPATSDWAHVTCRRCLVAGAETSAEARAHLVRGDAERAARRAAEAA